MDIAGLSMVMNQNRVMEDTSLAVMKIAMNTGKENAQAMTEMIEKSLDTNLGQHLDIRV